MLVELLRLIISLPRFHLANVEAILSLLPNSKFFTSAKIWHRIIGDFWSIVLAIPIRGGIFSTCRPTYTDLAILYAPHGVFGAFLLEPACTILAGTPNPHVGDHYDYFKFIQIIWYIHVRKGRRILRPWWSTLHMSMAVARQISLPDLYTGKVRTSTETLTISSLPCASNTHCNLWWYFVQPLLWMWQFYHCIVVQPQLHLLPDACTWSPLNQYSNSSGT